MIKTILLIFLILNTVSLLAEIKLTENQVLKFENLRLQQQLLVVEICQEAKLDIRNCNINLQTKTVTEIKQRKELEKQEEEKK